MGTVTEEEESKEEKQREKHEQEAQTAQTAQKAQSAQTAAGDESPEEEKFERFTRQRSTVRRSKRVNTKPNVVVASESKTADTLAATSTSAPVPRKRESLAKRCDLLN